MPHSFDFSRSDAEPANQPARERQRRTFEEEGYLTFEGVVEPRLLDGLTSSILNAFARVKASGRLFAGGGTVSGHLNCFPGAASRFVYQALAERGIFDVVRTLSTEPLRLPNIGCNLNLPGSSAQNEHVDGYASRPFLVVNVAAVDTNLTNGAMEILCRSHRKDYKYWQVMLERPERRRVPMKQGDVLIRSSALWHRGMPNKSSNARPMLAFTWEDGGSGLVDPYEANGGDIAFFPNRHRTDWLGQLRERAFVTAPRVGTAFRIAQSLLERDAKPES